MVTIASVLDTFGQLGGFRIVLPFLFTFAVVYGIVNRLDLFGEDTNDAVSAIIGIAAALFVSNYVVATGVQVGILFSNFFGALSVVFLFLLSALMVQGIVGGEPGNSRYNRAIMFLGALAVISIFLSWGGLGFVFPSTPDIAGSVFLTETTFATLVVILLAVGLIYWVTRSGGGGGEGGEEPEE